MIGTSILRDFSKLLLKYGVSLEDIMNMVYSQEELDPSTGKYKKYFDLITVKRNPDKYSDGYTYKIRYKLDLSGKKIPQGKVTYTTKTASVNEAITLGFNNRIDILKNYELSKDKPKGGNKFYKMLYDYYANDSKYLEDDSVNNKRDIVHKSRVEAQTFIKEDLIPYLKGKKINHISEITTSVYSGFKIYLQAKGIKDKTINNRLNYLLRIFDYHIRNGLLEKAPFTKGTSLIKLSGKQEKEDAEILPIEKLKGILPNIELIDPVILIRFMNFNLKGFPKLTKKEQEIIFSGYILPFTLCVLGLNTGMRNSEIARIKREDFIGVPEKETFLLRVWNKKTEYFNKTNESKYRKIPLHPYTIETVEIYIRKREELFGILKDTDFLFGNSIIDKDTKEIDGFIHSRVFDKTVYFILSLIKYKTHFFDFFSTDKELLEKIRNYKLLQEELKEIKNAGKGISYYSFRKTFRTMLGLNNDLAEYYMGHKLGDNAKTTYIQVNRLDNKLFFEEYAQPVIEMLNKYVFFSEVEMNKLIEKDNNKLKEDVDFFTTKMKQDLSLTDICIDYNIKEYNELKEIEKINLEKKKHFDKI